jgi:hypothetical protein
MSVAGSIFAMSLWLSALDGLGAESAAAGAVAADCWACALREPNRTPPTLNTTHNKAAANNEITRMA